MRGTTIGHAVAEGRTFTSGNLGGEPQWPRFGPRIGRLGVHSALSLPLLLPNRVVGALNVYAHALEDAEEAVVDTFLKTITAPGVQPAFIH